MTIKKEIAVKILRDATISLFIYALPVALMFGFFYIKGQRPWKDQDKSKTINVSSRIPAAEKPSSK